MEGFSTRAESMKLLVHQCNDTKSQTKKSNSHTTAVSAGLGQVAKYIRDARPAPPRPGPGGNGCPGPPRPRKFSTLPRPAPPHPGKRGRCPAPPRPENYPGARIGANVPTSSKVFGSQKLLTSIFSTKGALRRHVTYNNHPNLT